MQRCISRPTCTKTNEDHNDNFISVKEPVDCDRRFRCYRNPCGWLWHRSSHGRHQRAKRRGVLRHTAISSSAPAAASAPAASSAPAAGSLMRLFGITGLYTVRQFLNAFVGHDCCYLRFHRSGCWRRV